MIGAIVQPYLFPYLPYYALYSNVEIFIFLDDVCLNKQSYINNNKIFPTSNKSDFSLPIKKKSQNRFINQHEYSADQWHYFWRRLKSKFINNKLFSNSNLIEQTLGIINVIDSGPERNVALVNSLSIRAVSSLMTKRPQKVRFSSDLRKHIEPSLNGTAAIIELCKLSGISHYINPAGGVNLYQPFKSEFHSNGISLNYIDLSRYTHLYKEYTFLSFLSLITINDSYLHNLPLFTVDSDFYD